MLFMIAKVSPTNFVEKNNKKTKGQKTKKYIRNFKDNKIHKKFRLIREFFSSSFAKNTT